MIFPTIYFPPGVFSKKFLKDLVFKKILKKKGIDVMLDSNSGKVFQILLVEYGG